MKNNMSALFDREFFNGNRKELGVYQSYQFEDQYPEFKALANSIREHFNPRRLLDVGCAKGFLVKVFKDLGIETWGIDVSEYAISSSPPDVRPNLYKVDLNKDVFPFEDEYFDFVTFCGTIEYLNNHEHALLEINRVLIQGGYCYLTTLYKKDPRDEYRINIHHKGYYVKEFQSKGFRFEPEKSDTLLKIRLEQTLTKIGVHSLKFKVVKILYHKGGCLGKQVVLLLSRLLTRNYGILLFIKGGNGDTSMRTIY